MGMGRGSDPLWCGRDRLESETGREGEAVVGGTLDEGMWSTSDDDAVCGSTFSRSASAQPRDCGRTSFTTITAILAPSTLTSPNVAL